MNAEQLRVKRLIEAYGPMHVVLSADNKRLYLEVDSTIYCLVGEDFAAMTPRRFAAYVRLRRYEIRQRSVRAKLS